MYLFRFNSRLKLSRIWSTRKFSLKTPTYIERLKNRTLLKLSGPDTTNFLQNMITNDVKNVESTLYGLLLNASGRVLYDIILYKICDNEYLVEYDATGVEYVDQHLLMYRLRKNVKIQPLTDLTVWVAYKQFEDSSLLNTMDVKTISDHLKAENGIVDVTQDPRSGFLGIRVVAERDVNLLALLSPELDLIEGNSYKLLRYKLGIGEGVMDHPPGNCLPFETNVDLLNGVSFTKGCYIGQEMAARSHFVLSIRKRLMPVVFEEKDTYPIFPPECNIVNENNQKLGRLRSHFGKYGLGLLKYEDCLKSNQLEVKEHGIKLKALRPKWWPENLRSDKNEHIYTG